MSNKFLFVGGLLMLTMAACNNANVQQNYAPIVLGDSSTIVTEKDSNFLSNMVGDIDQQPKSNTDNKETNNATVTTNVTVLNVDTVKKEETNVETKSKAPATSGVAIHVGNDTYLLLEGVTVNGNKVIDGQKKSEHSFVIAKGKYNSAVVKVHNGKLNKAQYRYAVVPYLSISNKDIAITSLDAHVSNWSAIAAKGSVVNAPTVKNPSYKKVSGSQLKSAVEETLRSRNYKSSSISATTKNINNKTSVSQAPFSLDLNSFELKIQGVDAKGKSFDQIIKLAL